MSNENKGFQNVQKSAMDTVRDDIKELYLLDEDNYKNIRALKNACTQLDARTKDLKAHMDALGRKAAKRRVWKTWGILMGVPVVYVLYEVGKELYQEHKDKVAEAKKEKEEMQREIQELKKACKTEESDG